jgi:hypothetical protein
MQGWITGNADLEEFRIWPERFIDFRKKISQDARDKGDLRLAADPLQLLHPGQVRSKDAHHDTSRR